jgi:hypothetical protein
MTFSLSGGARKLELTISGKEYALNRVSGEGNDTYAGTWKLTSGDDDIQLTLTVAGDDTLSYSYTLSYTLENIPLNSAAQLAKIGADYPLNGKYELMANITLTNWLPIGTESDPFTGTFDGKGKTITLGGFGALSGNLGVFGYARGAGIHDLIVNLAWAEGTFELTGTGVQYAGGAVGYAGYEARLSNISVSGSGLKVSKAQGEAYIGGIAGRCHRGSEISGCTSAVDIDAYSTNGRIFAGGIAGDNHTGALITDCSAAGSVKAHTTGASVGSEGFAEAGGIAGRNWGSVISNSWAGGAIEAGADGNNSNAMAGGIAGQNIAEINTANPVAIAATITDCYSTGRVTATEGKRYARAGGIAGQAVCDQVNPVTIRRCYSTGEISASGTGNGVFAGGIVAENNSDLGPTGVIGRIVVEYCYTLGNINVSGSGSGFFAGGLTGLNSGNAGINADIEVRYNAALNKQITNLSSNEVYRIGQKNQAMLTGNIAYSGMLLNSGTVSSNDPDGVNGADKTATQLKDKNTWTNLFGSHFGSYWKWIGGYDYPALIWQDAAPAGAPTLP